MNLILIKTGICLALMIAFFLMAFIINDVVISQLFASIGMILGVYTYKFVSPKNIIKDEKH
jgi:hypothetical protein